MALFQAPVPEAEGSTRRSAAVTAAVASIPLGPGAAWSSWRFGHRDWQFEAWRLYDIVGELRFLAGWIGDSISQARLYVTRINASGEDEGEVTDPTITRIAAQPLGTGSQRDDNLRLLGIGLAVCGESWIVGDGGGDGEYHNWFVLSPGQLRRSSEVISVMRPRIFGGGKLDLEDGRDLLIRVWRPHPNDIEQADSPTRPSIPPLREIELATKREFAEMESRLTGPGILPVPEGWDFPRGEGDPEGVGGLVALMQRIFATNIRDQASASALVPIMFTVPDHMVEHLDKIKPINFWSDLSDKLTEIKEKAILRVGAAFEIPTEILVGIGDINHWGAWAISEEGIKRIKPYLSAVSDALTRGFLIPRLEKEGIADAESYAYAFDVSPLSVRPNRLPEALDLRDRFLLSDSETVKAGAFTEAMMPTEQERIKMLLFQAVASNPQLLLDPGIQSALGISRESIPVSATPVEQPQIAAPPQSAAPEQSPPPQSDQVSGTESAPMALIACEMVALRALELAGARLVPPAERRHRWPGVPRHELHTRINPRVTDAQIEKALEGAAALVPALAQRLGVQSEALSTALVGYCRALVRTGVEHRSEDLARALRGIL